MCVCVVTEDMYKSIVNMVALMTCGSWCMYNYTNSGLYEYIDMI